MKKNVILFLLIIPYFSFSQVSYLAGDALPVYVDFNPDTLIDAFCQPDESKSETYDFDINGDSQNDFRIDANCWFALGGNGAHINAVSLNSNLNILYGRTDSVYHTYLAYWWIADVAKPLAIGDTINSFDASWDSSLVIYLNIYSAGTGQSVYDWIDSADKFIGIRYVGSSDTVYGWIRVNCLHGCLLKDYALSSSLIGIEENTLDGFSIYPNPATDKICVTQSNSHESEISLFDVLGKQVMPPLKSNKNKTEINVGDLSRGIYFIQLKTEKRALTRKIIICK